MVAEPWAARGRIAVLTAVAAVAGAASDMAAQQRTPPADIAAATAGFARQPGLITIYLTPDDSTVYFELPRDSVRVLYHLSLATGLGSTAIALDRGAARAGHVARFERAGRRVMLRLENWKFRGSPTQPDHAVTVAESFAGSTLAALPLLAAQDGRLLVDATEFVYGDWVGVAATLEAKGQGIYAVARDRSGIHRLRTKAFPANTEIEVSLTYALAGGKPGTAVAGSAPDGRAITLRQHFSFLQLPADGYRPRGFDPRVGYLPVSFKDYGAPVQAALERRWVARHRLRRRDAADPSSPIERPIVFYLDRGIPEPVRGAVKEGMAWWSTAFDAAGLRGGFVVEDLPKGVDPLDARYNVVQWVNRDERGWSSGASLGDPRTGEILKAMVRLDSHRERADYQLYAGLAGVEPGPDDTAFVLARARQKAAHEVGHALGLAHNYAGSVRERASVMDYPPPRVMIDEAGNVDLSDAYATGIGSFDIFAIRWGYGIFPEGHESDSLAAILDRGVREGYRLLTDEDARSESSAEPGGNAWDDQASPSVYLDRQMRVRRVAMARMGVGTVAVGEPLARLRERLAPVYLMHRFAVVALAKVIGGVEYGTVVRGDGLRPLRPIDGATQRAALRQLLGALDPRELAIPDTLLGLLAPRPYGYDPSPDEFQGRTGPVFDELGAARTLAQLVVDAVLQRERAARLVQGALHSTELLTLPEVVDSLVAFTWMRPAPSDARLAALQRVTQRAVLHRLGQLAADSAAAPEVRSIADFQLTALGRHARSRAAQSGPTIVRAHWHALAAEAAAWADHRGDWAPSPPLPAPPGEPIGSP